MVNNPLVFKRLSLLLVLIAFMLLWVVLRGAPVKAQISNTSNAPVAAQAQRQVRTVQAEFGTLSTTRSTSITIDPAQESLVAAGASGQVAKVLYREGSYIAADDVVIQLDDVDIVLQVNNARIALQSASVNLRSAERASQESIGAAQAALNTSNANFRLAERQYNEGKALFAAGGIAANDLTGLEAQYAGAQTNLIQANDNVARSNRAGSEDLALLRLQVQQAQNQLAQANRLLNETKIRAPFTGEVADVLAEQGEFIATGSPAFRLVSTENQLARFNVPTQDADSLLVQQEIFIRFNGLDYGAWITRSSQISGQSRLVEVTAELYPSDTAIPTGTVTQLDYQLNLGEGVLLPSGAVQTSAGERFVYQVNNGAALKKTVQIIGEAGGNVAVEGLGEGAEIVYPVPADLRDATPISVIASAGS